MRRPTLLLSVLLLAGLLAFASAAYAAKVTDVLDAADGADGPLDIDLSVDFSQHFESGVITRERNTSLSVDRTMLHQDEFVWKSQTSEMAFKGRIGLYHDLELHFTLPVTISEKNNGWLSGHWRNKFWGGTTERYNPTSTAFSFRSASLLNERIFGYPSWETMRSGFGDMTLGLAYAPLSEDRDRYYPTMLLGFDVILPSGKKTEPSMDSSSKNQFTGTNGNQAKNKGVGKKLATFILKTAISKRLGAADPYFSLEYRIPVNAGGYIKNPRQEGRFMLGTEAVAYERKLEKENEPFFKIAFDVCLSATLYGKGQDYSPITDPLAWRKDKNNTANEIYWEDDPRAKNLAASDYYYSYNGKAPAYVLPTMDSYVYVQGTAGFYAILGHYFQVRSDFSIGHRGTHYLSLPKKIDSQTLRPADRSGYNTQINETGTRVQLYQSLVMSYTMSLGFLY